MPLASTHIDIAENPAENPTAWDSTSPQDSK